MFTLDRTKKDKGFTKEEQRTVVKHVAAFVAFVVLLKVFSKLRR